MPLGQEELVEIYNGLKKILKKYEGPFKPELLKLLKGKSCFYIRDLSPEIVSQVEEALEIGFNLYKKWGWV